MQRLLGRRQAEGDRRTYPAPVAMHLPFVCVFTRVSLLLPIFLQQDKLAKIAADLEAAASNVAAAGGATGPPTEADVEELAASASGAEGGSGSGSKEELTLDPKLAVRIKILSDATATLDKASAALGVVKGDMKTVRTARASHVFASFPVAHRHVHTVLRPQIKAEAEGGR